jgi:hypothetical protein
MQIAWIGGFLVMAHHLCSVVFYCLMTAQAFGAVVSCAYPWHRVDHNHDDADTGRQVRGFEPLRMQWYPA